ncbi:hypothetical protein TCAL_11840 [Tigriopus californicus]|uniref:DOMON domain-containing protein n=1 Tax=Tigriopus californicus TaxID=6832 RepID=A0A553NER2_TIGCA|nr:dopamine beta-hydroxylase-like [Tigriopus californicus]TRY63859.1 hypothetical protein TCAL_11840 [Tigriopus californicus]|eukprot:TCALIF_11840-PA protein Name:"Similar to Dbh Dopamine beta-hydroxylase (Mus musculus)" AED:0.03 eAED:0.03 QI:206/1/1/1/1/1/10/336/1023
MIHSTWNIVPFYLMALPILTHQFEFLDQGYAPIFSETLTTSLTLNWQVDYEGRTVHFEVEHAFDQGGSESDWIAIGFSDHGELPKADLCLTMMDWNGDLSMHDVNVDELTQVHLDHDQNCLDFNHKLFDDGLIYGFSRSFDTCDPQDYIIEDGTTHVIWALDRGPIESIKGITLDSVPNGMIRTRLLKVPDVPPLPMDEQSLDFFHEIEIPSDDTTYWCSMHRLPPELIQKHHVVQYEPIKTAGNEHILHHMEVFHCDAPPDEEFPLWQGPCGADDAPPQLQKCKKVLAAWAIGAGPFTYPENAGLAIGGPDFNPYVMLEVHYNNENMEAGHQDQSGMRLHVTDQLRAYDAGIMELGLIYTDRMAIPPQMTEFPLSGHCLPSCTAEGFPDQGITVFGSQLHTHGTGVRVATLHVRDGHQLPDLNRDNHYSTHFQEIRALHDPVQVLPGDGLINRCWHNTMTRTNATLGGYGFRDEMCLNYIHYYPKIELEICKSSVDRTALEDYFRYLNEVEDQPTSAFKNVSENYHTIEWTPRRSLDLENFYSKAPIEMQCQGGNGLPLPGNSWKNMKIMDIEDPLPIQPRECQDIIQSKRFLGANYRPKRFLGANTRYNKRMGFNPKMVAIYRERMQDQETRRRRGLRSKKETASNLGLSNLRFDLFNRFFKRSGSPMNEMRKRAGQSFNEMKRAPTGIRMRKADTKNMVRMRKNAEQGESVNINSLMQDPEFSKRLWSTRMKKNSLHQNRFNDLERGLRQAFSVIKPRDEKRVFGKIRLRDFERAEANARQRRRRQEPSKKDYSLGLSHNILDNPYVNYGKRSSRNEHFNQLSSDLNDALNLFNSKRASLRPDSFTGLENSLHEAYGMLNNPSNPNNPIRRADKRSSKEERLNDLESNLSETLNLLNGPGWKSVKGKRSSANGLRFSKLNQEVDDLLTAFGQKKRGKRSSPISNRELDELESKLRDAFTLLNNMETDDNQFRKRFGKRTQPESLNDDYEEEYEKLYESETWPDYPTWGLDRRKKGLGSVV